jgi:hypothetical protein
LLVFHEPHVLTRQLYELDHPLYPHKDLLKYFADHKIAYTPYQGGYDDAYRNWYQLVRADHDLSGAAIRPITREISQIIRFKSSGKEFLKYSETLWGLDHDNNPIPFFHTYGEYIKPNFKQVYNYETRTASTIRSGSVETVYFIEFNKDLIDQLYEAGPDNMDIELLVNVGSKQYGGRGFYTYEEFRNLSIEELGKIGNAGKNMFTQNVITTPQQTIADQLKALGGGVSTSNQQQLWQEFQEFIKFRQQNAISNKIKVKGIDEK